MSGWQPGQYDPAEHQRRAARPAAVLMCIAFGGGYFAKIPVKKALSEMHSQPSYR